MDVEKILTVGDNGSNLAPYMAMMNNSQFNNPWAYLILLALFQNGGFGFGGNRGTNGVLDMETQNKLNALQTQLNDSQNANNIQQALQGNSFAISQLSQNLGVNYSNVLQAINTVNSSIAQVASQNGMGFMGVTNAINNGNASLSRQLCECCCENRLLTNQQGYENRIQTIEQTNQLGSQADRNTRSLADAIAAQSTMITKEFCDVKEREMQDKINTLQLENTALKSTAQINAALAPIIAELNAIKAAQPQTITLPYSQYSVVPTAQSAIGYDVIATLIANRLSANNGTTATTPAS